MTIPIFKITLLYAECNALHIRLSCGSRSSSTALQDSEGFAKPCSHSTGKMPLFVPNPHTDQVKLKLELKSRMPPTAPPTSVA